ncbi:hypothetical protein FF1_019941 [Malus domestica]
MDMQTHLRASLVTMQQSTRSSQQNSRLNRGAQRSGGVLCCANGITLCLACNEKVHKVNKLTSSSVLPHAQF